MQPTPLTSGHNMAFYRNAGLVQGTCRVYFTVNSAVSLTECKSVRLFINLLLLFSRTLFYRKVALSSTLRHFRLFMQTLPPVKRVGLPTLAYTCLTRAMPVEE
jgi:hypothetical protein